MANTGRAFRVAGQPRANAKPDWANAGCHQSDITNFAPVFKVLKHRVNIRNSYEHKIKHLLVVTKDEYAQNNLNPENW